MKRKVKLFSTIASLCLVLAIMTVTALAAQSVNVYITNNVSYDVGANVKAIISATKEAGDNTIIKSGDEDIDPKIFTGDEGGDDAIGNLSLGNVELGAISIASGLKIVFSYIITIQNTASLSDEINYLEVNFTAPNELPFISGGYGISVEYYKGVYVDKDFDINAYDSNISILAPGEYHSMKVTFTGDANTSHDTSGEEVLYSSVKLSADSEPVGGEG